MLFFMKKTILMCLCIICIHSICYSYEFSFNDSSMEDIINGAKDDGFIIPKNVAQAIVDYRKKYGRFKDATELFNIKEIPRELIIELAPLATGDDLIYTPENVPGMKGY